MNRRAYLASVLSLAMTILCILPESLNAQDSTKTADKVKTAEEALALALEYTGFARAKDTSTMTADQMVKKVTIADDETPFLNQRINGRELWQVTFDSVKLDLPGVYPSVLAKQTPKTYDVLIDPRSGQLLRILSRYSGDGTGMPHRLSAKEKEESMGYSFEKYHDFVAEPQATDFYEALCQTEASNPVMAKQITGLLVVYTGGGAPTPRPVWIVTELGTPVFEKSGTAFVGWITSVDAVSGKGLRARAIY